MQKFTDADLDRISLNLSRLVMNIIKTAKPDRDVQTQAKVQVEIIETLKYVRGR
jgi:hypothetical protein